MVTMDDVTQEIPTRFLILSDTHGDRLNQVPEEPVDVLIHCGDITEESKLAEFRAMINHLQSFNAPLKLVIAGNHDFTLDDQAFEKKLTTIKDHVSPALIKREYGDFGEARSLFESKEAKAANIHFLDGGPHTIHLPTGALLRIYASPFKPSLNDWAFQYNPSDGHVWPIQPDVDVVITHGPPHGIFDRVDGKRVGDPDLFAAARRVRPQLHCFGHLHENWGARRVTWRAKTSERPSHFTDIDNDRSEVIETLASVRAGRFDSEERAREKVRKLQRYNEKGFCEVGRCPQRGVQTVFVNAAIEGEDEESQHLPWLVELNLLRSKEVEER